MRLLDQSARKKQVVAPQNVVAEEKKRVRRRFEHPTRAQKPRARGARGERNIGLSFREAPVAARVTAPTMLSNAAESRTIAYPKDLDPP